MHYIVHWTHTSFPGINIISESNLYLLKPFKQIMSHHGKGSFVIKKKKSSWIDEKNFFLFNFLSPSKLFIMRLMQLYNKLNQTGFFFCSIYNRKRSFSCAAQTSELYFIRNNFVNKNTMKWKPSCVFIWIIIVILACT